MNMPLVYNFPRWLVDEIYDSVLGRDCTTKTMSIKATQFGPSFTGGSRIIKPIHNRNKDYMSLEVLAETLQSGMPVTEESKEYWNVRRED